MSTWVEQAIQAALVTIPLDSLMDAAADHVKVKGEWAPFTFRPSVLNESCRLARLKKFYGHTPQPGNDFSAVRQGKPSGTTAINFARGYFMEGLLVAALKQYVEDSEEPQLDPAEVWNPYKVLGCSPSLVFKAFDHLLGFPVAAHPDVVVEFNDEVELIQMKSPSVFKFDRVEKNGDSEFDSYTMQLITEMYFGRLAGYDIKRTHLLMATFEGNPPRGKSQDGARLICRTWEWDDDMAVAVEAVMAELKSDYEESTLGTWPDAFPIEEATRYPCTYCNYSRTGSNGLVACNEVKKWDL